MTRDLSGRDWKSYPGDRLRHDHPVGFVVIVPKESMEAVPVWCPVCHMAMQSSEDGSYFRAKGCCTKCGMKWADPNIERWKSGWRPSQRDVDAFVTERQAIPVSLNLGD